MGVTFRFMVDFGMHRLAVAVIVVFLCIVQGYSAPQHTPVKGVTRPVVEFRPEEFGGVDPCLRDTTGSENSCSRRYGVVRSPGGKPERPCVLAPEALEAFKVSRKILKEENPDLEIFVISSYRPPGHQQCLWVKKTSQGYRCNRYVCGPRDPKTRKRLPCRIYDLSDPRYAHIFDNCPHVNHRTVDVCAYNRRRVKLNVRNQMDLTTVEDCRKFASKGHKLAQGWSYHPCCCRFASWTEDFRRGSARAKKVFGPEAVEAQRAMIRAMRKAGWRDDAPGEWWHFRYAGK